MLQRQPEFNDEHGPERLAILFVGAEGCRTFDVLFCRRAVTPFCFVLQEHGGIEFSHKLEFLAMTRQLAPPLLLVAENTKAWDGYARPSDVQSEAGGMHGYQRFLYRRFA